uniref:Protein PHYTOCHROME KINASE SUBSTRATE 4 n=1 Tax=Cajanus cajan TaxID=3821 RepID=A0A151TAJ3_CAJCA|nr:hypothetical protein KK1_018633 [Cajanus cajan]
MKTGRDRDASFSSYLRPDDKVTITGEDSTTELSIFDAHKYFNDDNNNNVQKVSISRVSPMERIPERGDVIMTEATRYSSASSSVDGFAHIRNYRARSNPQNPKNPKLSNPKPIWRRKCPCTGRKSVQVKESTQGSKSNTPPLDHEHVNVLVSSGRAPDASSDLFEIESFSTATQSTYPAACRRNSRDSFDEASASTSTATTTTGFFFGRRSMDEGSTTATITECYEPSEASIEWSVTTAEGHEEGVSAAEEKWKRKGGNGLLVSCRCEKAVSVGPQPVKCGSEGQRSATSASASAHVNVTSLSGVHSRIGSINKPPLARAHRNAPRVSLAFAT